MSSSKAQGPPEAASRIELAPLKCDARAGYPASHPYRLAVEALPDTVSPTEFQAQLRILLPLSRMKEA